MKDGRQQSPDAVRPFIDAVRFLLAYSAQGCRHTEKMSRVRSVQAMRTFLKCFNNPLAGAYTEMAITLRLESG
jgi:hypothetical protein